MNTPDDFTGPVNIGNPSEFTIKQLADQVIRLTGSHSELVFKPLPADDPKRRQPDITLAKSALKWSPTIELNEGLERTVTFFRKKQS
jgi:UDP-glucuronate decarboxylase